MLRPFSALHWLTRARSSCVSGVLAGSAGAISTAGRASALLLACLVAAAGGGSAGCLNPQPEPPAALASSGPQLPDDDDGRGGEGASGSAGSSASNGGGVDDPDVPPSPGASGSGGSGAAGDGGFEGSEGGAGGGAAAGSGGAAGSDDAGAGSCRPCGEWLRSTDLSKSATIERPLCDGAVEAIEDVVACIAEPCAVCAERFAREQVTTPACLACFRRACPDEVATCLGAPSP
jgi:hypothetical protein